MFEVIEHTADVGIRVEADNLKNLFLDAAEGMFAVMLESKPNLIPAITIPIDVQLTNPDQVKLSFEAQLLVKWLQELLFVFETRHIVPTHFFIDQISKQGLEGCYKGLKFDKRYHKLLHEIKAVTYHQLQVNQTERGWEARVIFDI
ncbi:MAG: archease [Pseudomonadota bacterium]